MRVGQQIVALGRWMIVEDVDMFEGVEYVYTIDKDGQDYEITAGMIDHVY